MTLTNITTHNALLSSPLAHNNTDPTGVRGLLRTAKQTKLNAPTLERKGVFDDILEIDTNHQRDLASCNRPSINCLEGLTPTHIRSPIGSVFTGSDVKYIPNSLGESIGVNLQDVDAICMANWEDAKNFVSSKNNATATLEDVRKNYNGGEVFCATEKFDVQFIPDSFSKSSHAELVIKEGVITPECPDGSHPIFQARSEPWSLGDGFRRNLKKSSTSTSGNRNNDGCSALPSVTCDDHLSPTHKRVVPGSVFANNLDMYYVPNVLGDSIRVNGVDVGVECVRTFEALQNDLKTDSGKTPTLEDVRKFYKGGEVYCTNTEPQEKLYPNPYNIQSHASQEIERSENGTETIVAKCPDGTVPTFITNAHPYSLADPDTRNELLKNVGIGAGVFLAFVLGGSAVTYYKNRNR